MRKGCEERENILFSAIDDIQSTANQLVAEGHFVSILPVDPFTASAALLELMAAGGTSSEAKSTVEIEPPNDLTPREQNILEALAELTMQAQELADASGYPNN